MMRTEARTMAKVVVYGGGAEPTEVDLADVARIAGGYTLAHTSGGWTTATGRLVTEPGWTLTVLAKDRLTARMAVAWTIGAAIGRGESEVWAEVSEVEVEVTSAN